MPKSRKSSAVLIISIIIISSIGFVMTHNVFADIQHSLQSQLAKLDQVARLANRHYVEDVDWDKAMEGAISGMLENLDPHSVYIPADKVKENKESFAGKYEGIGIQFDVIDGYLTVISPIPGSPSYRLGIIAGDRIVKIDGESAVGISVDDVPNRLKGPKGSSVDVTISRVGEDEPLEFTIVRDVIPISTITAGFMVDDSTGYLAVNRFASITSREVEEELQELEKHNLRRLVLDLRWNSGGYLHEAVKLAGKFIHGHKKIVYTQGRAEGGDEDYYSDQFGRTSVRDYPLIVLINRGSASAAEIVAGAIQDYDRGLILGENSFGKGLVQKEFMLDDGSAVRITTAKYYTPSGRCIQRDYKGKKVEEYYDEIPDSTWGLEANLKDRPVYQTQKGRQVYGGGGIQPDVYVPNSGKSKAPKLVNKLLEKRIFFEYATSYAQAHPQLNTSLADFRERFHAGSVILAEFQALARKKGVDLDAALFEKDREFISNRIKSEIARIFWENDGYYFVSLENDSQFQQALKSFKEAREMAALH